MTATMTDYRLEVLSRLWDKPEGLTIPGLLGSFDRSEREDVIHASLDLECRGLVMRAGRNTISDGYHRVETRLVAWRGKGIK